MKLVQIYEGPIYTLFEFSLNKGVKLPSFNNLEKELKIFTGYTKLEIIEKMPPNYKTFGVKIENNRIEDVYLYDVLKEKKKDLIDMKLPIILGKDDQGRNKIFDLAKAPHLLIAGATGSGITNFIYSIIASIIINKKPYEVNLILMGPKENELSTFNGIPHLGCPVIYNKDKISFALQGIVKEIYRRNSVFVKNGVNNINQYNNKLTESFSSVIKDYEIIPYLLVIIDDINDIIYYSKIEESIIRISESGRSVGIHLVVSSKSVSSSIISNNAKINFESRIAFTTADINSSIMILDKKGAEKLHGYGEMIFKTKKQEPFTVKSCLITNEEEESIKAYCMKQQIAFYNYSYITNSSYEKTNMTNDVNEDDPLYDEIVEYCILTGIVSASLLQRKFRLGYKRAARIVDVLEERGIIGPQEGSKPREVLIKK